MSKDKHTISFKVDDAGLEMLDRLVEERVFVNRSDAMRNALREMYNNNFKDYIDVQRERNEIKKKALEQGESVSNQEAGSRRKEKNDIEEKKEICKKLNGEIEGDEDKGYTCRFDQYALLNPNYVEKYEQKMDLRQLSEQTLEDQYEGGSKEQLLEIYNDE